MLTPQGMNLLRDWFKQFRESYISRHPAAQGKDIELEFLSKIRVGICSYDPCLEKKLFTPDQTDALHKIGTGDAVAEPANMTDRERRQKDSLKKTLVRLRQATRECRIDMHEPDEQSIRAYVAGHTLDNAMEDDPKTNQDELTVTICRDGNEPEHFNLATLIALARLANLD